MSDIAIRPAATSLHAFLSQALTNADVNVEKLQAVLEMQRQIVADEEEREFAIALSAVQAEIPQVKKNGTIELKGGKVVKFAKWHEIDAVLRPIYVRHNFALTFSTEPRAQGPGLIVTGRLSRGRTFQTASIPLPPDCGPGRNDLQAINSTMSYSYKIIATMFFNIVKEDEDDDGKRGGAKFITPDQVEELAGLCEQVGRPPEEILDRMFRGSVRSLAEIEAHETFLVVRSLLEGMKAKRSRESGAGP